MTVTQGLVLVQRQNAQKIIIRPTRTHDVLDEKGRQSSDSRLLCRDRWILREQ